MRMLHTRTLFPLLTLLAAQIPASGATDIMRRGTMVVAVRFNNGLVVCADKRSHLDGPGLTMGNYRDDDVKITIVGQSGGFVTAGVPILERADGVRVFDADEVIADYLRVAGFTDFARLTKSIEDAFRGYVLSKPPAERPPTMIPDGQPVFLRAMIFFVAKNRVTLYDLELLYINADPPIIHGIIQDRSEDRLRAYGTLVLKEVLKASDPRFTDLRGDAILFPVLNMAWPSRLTEQRALAFAKKAITVTSERIGFLDKALVPSFGPTSDCALARSGKPIEWLPQGS